MENIRLAIIGSRSFNDFNLVCSTLDKNVSKIESVVSGGAKGADTLGQKWAQKHKIPTKIFYPDWDKYGKRAGFIRNESIINNCDAVIAFWDGNSKGTLHSIMLANKLNIPVKVISF